MVKAGDITVNGRPVKKNRILVAGDCVEIAILIEPGNWPTKPTDGTNLDVLFEDEYLMVLNKPSGIHTVSLSPDDTNSIASMIAAYFPECATVGNPGDAGLVQRLDNPTSGLVICAKNDDVHKLLVEQQKLGLVTKFYKALVMGEPKIDQQICEPLQAKGRGQKLVGVSKDGKESVSIIKKIERIGVYNLLTVKIHKGYRHQIRVHLDHIVCSIAGDDLYGDLKVEGLNRLFLHCSKIIFNHPVKDVPLEINANLPQELQSIIDQNR